MLDAPTATYGGGGGGGGSSSWSTSPGLGGTGGGGNGNGGLGAPESGGGGGGGGNNTGAGGSGGSGVVIVQFTNPAYLPVVTTTQATSITQSSAASGGDITTGSATAVGIVYAPTQTNPDPTFGGVGVTAVSPPPMQEAVTGMFTVNLAGLSPGTTYSYAAYASSDTSDPGMIAYGAVLTLTTASSLASQTISFTSVAPTTATYGGTYTVTATASSGLPVTLSVDSTSTTVCSLSGSTSGSTVSFTGVGACAIDANQTGNADYTPAPQVQQSFSVGQAAQTISFTSVAPTTATYGGTYTVTATASSGLPVTLSVDSTSTTVCSLSGSTSGSTVSFTGVGACAIDANQTGNADYTPAPQVQQSFSVGQAPLTITAASPSITYGDAVPTMSASYSGFVNGDGIASLSTAPSCVTTYTQGLPVGSYATSCSGAVDSNYTIGYVPGTLTVSPAPLTITASSATITYGQAAPTVTPSYTGLENGDLAPATPPLCSTTIPAADLASNGDPTTAGSPYVTNCTGATDPNYNITTDSGTLVVSPATTAVRLSQNNPHAVQVASSGSNKGMAPAMTFAARITETGYGPYGQFTSFNAPVTFTLTPVGPGSPITCTVPSSSTSMFTLAFQQATATSPGFEVVTCTVPAGTPVNVYEVEASVGGDFQGADVSVLTVYEPTPGSSTGGGYVTGPETGDTNAFAYSATYLKNGQVQGKFLDIEYDSGGNVAHILKGNVMATMAIVNNEAIVTGKATLDGVGNYSYILSGIDNGTNSPGQYGQQVTDPAGNVVTDVSFSPILITCGNISVQAGK